MRLARALRPVFPPAERTGARRASFSLHYGETLQVRLRLARGLFPHIARDWRGYFDSDGFLRAEHLRQFDRVLEKLRAADETIVVYSDVLDFIDRENELALGLDEERRSLAQLEHREESSAKAC